MSSTKKLVLALSAGTAMLLSSTAMAQTAATIDGTEITEAQLDVYAIGRTGESATAENRTALLEQIGDLVVLSNVALNGDLAKDPALQAEVELQRRSVMATAVIRDFREKNPITDQEVRAEYDRQIKDVPAPTQYKARHILVETKEDADGVIAQLKDGADFEALAAEKSTGPSGPNGGDLGWFDAASMVAPFSAAVVAMENGKYSAEPVQTDFGWHVILREDSRQAEPPAFEELEDRLRQSMEQQKFQDYFLALKAAASLEVK
ncbi:MAG: peptidylprolyl isomerase [Pseudomonadota bacterium]